MRKQYALKYTFGLAVDQHEPPRAIDKWRIYKITMLVRNAACQLAGGCTVHTGKGYWREDGAEKRAMFSGKQHEEQSTSVSFSVEPYKLQMTLEVMQQEIGRIMQEHAPDVHWVHVEQYETIGHHFNAQEISCHA